MDFYVVSDDSLTSIADAIRSKSGQNQPLVFPHEFIYEINNLSNAGTFENIFIDTTQNWNTQLNYVPAIGDIIIYSDKSTITQNDVTKNIPGIKIGDGNAYCVDLPFIADDVAAALLEHINDNVRHITAQERQFWNNKLNVNINGEELQFTRN